MSVAEALGDPRASFASRSKLDLTFRRVERSHFLSLAKEDRAKLLAKCAIDALPHVRIRLNLRLGSRKTLETGHLAHERSLLSLREGETISEWSTRILMSKDLCTDILGLLWFVATRTVLSRQALVQGIPKVAGEPCFSYLPLPVIDRQLAWFLPMRTVSLIDALTWKNFDGLDNCGKLYAEYRRRRMHLMDDHRLALNVLNRIKKHGDFKLEKS